MDAPPDVLRRSGSRAGGDSLPWMSLAVLLLLVGLALLIGGAELLVRGGGQIALGLRVPALIVGLTVVAFGTSAPELAVSVSAALNGSTDAAMANVVGSNIANVLLVLGAAALIRPLVVDRALIKRELPALLVLQLLLPLLCFDGRLTFIDGGVLLVLGLLYNLALVLQALRDRRTSIAVDLPEPGSRWYVDLLMLIVGIGVLIGGAQLFVQAALEIARWFSLSDRVVGLTVIALGTSAPELVTTAVSSWRGEGELAMGNVVGSNILNIALVLGLTAMIQPIIFDDFGLMVDIGVAVAAAVFLVPVAMFAGRIGRLTGGLMFASYVAYLVLLS